jgi:hypothetical protein
MLDNNINKIDQTATATDSLQPVVAPVKTSANQDGLDPLLFAYMEIYRAMQITHQTAQVNAKVLAANAASQEDLIQEEAKLHFATLGWHSGDTCPLSNISIPGVQNNLPQKTPVKIDPEKLSELELHNQEISALRSGLGNKITMRRQEAEMVETKLNTDVNECQEYMQQGIGLMQMLVSLTNQISRV